MKEINIIVAMGKNNEIGLDNQLLWHIKPDFNYFKATTKGHIMIMGRKTFLSLPNGPLKHRENIVITSDKDFSYEGVYVVHSIKESLAKANEIGREDQKIFIIGGASIYKQFMPIADKLYITHVFESFEADTYFPKIDQEWILETSKIDRENIEHKYPHLFAVYKRN